MKITDFLVMNSHGDDIAGDPYGNNVAFSCHRCGHPVLAIALANRRGSDERHPAKCRGCGLAFFLDVRERAKQLYIFTVSTDA